MSENEEYPQEEDQIAKRIEEVIGRIQNLRRPFRQRRQAIINGILRGMEARSRERYRYHNPSFEEEESEVEKLKAEVERLKQQLNEMHKRPRPTVAIRPE